MIRELMGELLEQLCAAALDDVLVATIVHEGEPCRFVIYAPTGVMFGILVQRGETVRILRDHRLLIEPIERVRLRSLQELTNWRTM